MTLPLSRLEKWEPGHGRLYDLTLTYGEDKVESYFGMREVRLDGEKFLINDKSVFQRLVLDQGFYPDGIYTALQRKHLSRMWNCPWMQASTAQDSIRRYLSLCSCITAIKQAIWYGASRAVGDWITAIPQH